MNTKFYLRDKNATDKTSLVMYCRWNGYKMKYSTNLRILPKHWNTQKQKIHSRVSGAMEINKYLEQLQQQAIEFYFQHQSQNKIVGIDELKTFLNSLSTDQNKLETFEDIVNEFLTEKQKVVNKSTFKKIKTSFGSLEKYCKVRKIKLQFQKITNSFMLDYCHYLTSECNLLNESIKDGQIKYLKNFLKWASENGYNQNTDYQKFKFPYKVVQSDQVYLTEKELNTLHKLKLENSYLDKIRDVFLIECYTGLRYSDLKQIKPDRITSNQIKIIQQKTAKTVHVPIASEAKKIMDKYFSKDLNLPIISNQKMNQYLKDLMQFAKINTPTTKTRFSGNERTEITEPKYRFIASHTARRTFVTIAYLRNMKPLGIMQITGHTNYNTFMKYAKLDQLNVHKSFYKAWDGVNPEVSQIIENLIKEKVPIDVISRATGVPVEKINN